MIAKQYSNEDILKRIDAIMKELQGLRQFITQSQTDHNTISKDIAEELAGSLGQGTWQEYDSDLDWKRFSL